MWPSAHLQMPLRAYFVSFRSINSLTPCRAYNIQRTHKGQRDAAPWRHHRVVGKRKPGTPLQPELKLITLPPTSLTECTLPAWHSKAKMMRAYHLPSLRGWEGGGRDLICMTTCPKCHTPIYVTQDLGHPYFFEAPLRLKSHKKELNIAIYRDVGRPRDRHTEWSKSEREKQILYNIAYMWNLEKWYRWTYFQSRNRGTDVENKLTDTKQGRGSGMNWEIETDIYTLLCIKQITNENLLYSKGSSTQCSVVTFMERKSKKRGYMYTCGWFTLPYCRNQHNTVK